MSRHSIAIQRASLDHEHPFEWHTSKMGYKFDSSSDRWQIDGSIQISLNRKRNLDAKTQEGLRKSLCRYAEELSATTTRNALTKFYFYCDQTSETKVSVLGLTKWRSSLTAETEWWMGTLKSFLIAWNEWGYPGVDNDVVNYLEELSLKGNVKGKAVKRACPYSGPLTQIELGSLLDWASNAFLKNTIDLNQYAYFLTLAFTGRRAVQIRSLRSCDLIYNDNSDGHDYVVKFPRAKLQGSGFRKAFNPLSVNEDLFLILQNQAEASQSMVEGVLGQKLPLKISQQIPVFLAVDRCASLQDLDHLIKCLQETPDYLHMTNIQAMEVLKVVAIKIWHVQNGLVNLSISLHAASVTQRAPIWLDVE